LKLYADQTGYAFGPRRTSSPEKMMFFRNVSIAFAGSMNEEIDIMQRLTRMILIARQRFCIYSMIDSSSGSE
jgi:hypothetical protein